jgi:hypothetical protein
MSCHVHIPEKFQQDSQQSVRYKQSYEAFWWNCIMVKASGLTERCPFLCSGWGAATYGCADGAHDAMKQITQLLNSYAPDTVVNYLESIASNKEGREKITPYFPNGPRPEKIDEEGGN